MFLLCVFAGFFLLLLQVVPAVATAAVPSASVAAVPIASAAASKDAFPLPVLRLRRLLQHPLPPLLPAPLQRHLPPLRGRPGGGGGAHPGGEAHGPVPPLLRTLRPHRVHIPRGRVRHPALLRLWMRRHLQEVPFAGEINRVSLIYFTLQYFYIKNAL